MKYIKHVLFYDAYNNLIRILRDDRPNDLFLNSNN